MPKTKELLPDAPQCQVCFSEGKVHSANSLITHLIREHGLKPKEYSAKYAGAPFMAESLRAKSAEYGARSSTKKVAQPK